MIQLPYDEKLKDEDQVIFVSDDLWVPISVVNGNIHILPGIPRLFEKMLEGLKPRILPRLVDPEGKGVHRILFSTPLAESEVADYLTQLSEKVESKGVKVGSYPRWGESHNTVTLVGRDREYMDSLVERVEKDVKGKRVAVEGEDDDAGEEDETNEDNQDAEESLANSAGKISLRIPALGGSERQHLGSTVVYGGQHESLSKAIDAIGNRPRVSPVFEADILATNSTCIDEYGYQKADHKHASKLPCR